jgi:hypothetical protein
MSDIVVPSFDYADLDPKVAAIARSAATTIRQANERQIAEVIVAGRALTVRDLAELILQASLWKFGDALTAARGTYSSPSAQISRSATPAKTAKRLPISPESEGRRS